MKQTKLLTIKEIIMRNRTERDKKREISKIRTQEFLSRLKKDNV